MPHGARPETCLATCRDAAGRGNRGPPGKSPSPSPYNPAMWIRPVALVLGGVACAAPAAPPSAAPAAAPARDAGPAPDTGSAPDAAAEADDDPPVDPRYRFAWQA